MKNILTTALLLSLALTACSTVTPAVDPVETPAEAETYTWEKYGISFEVPEGLQVSNPWDGDILVVDSVDYSTFEGELLGQIRIYPSNENTIEEAVQSAKEAHELSVSNSGILDETAKDFQIEDVTLGNNTYTKVSTYELFGNLRMEDYLIERNGTVFMFVKGAGENDTAMESILESLEF